MNFNAFKPPSEQGKYKPRKKGSQGGLVESVFFIPFTEGSRLKKILQEREEKQTYRRKFKFVEKMGLSMGNKVCRPEASPAPCGRDCFPCQTKPGACQRQGFVYKIKCVTCFRNEGADRAYIGESATTPFDRGEEWLTAIRKRDPNSPLEQHASERHPEAEREFEMTILKFTPSPLIRQTSEAQRLRGSLK